MQLALATVIDVILPVFLVIGVGVLVDRRFALDRATMLRLNYWVFVPALCAEQMLRIQLPSGAMATVALHTALFMVAMASLAWLAASLLRLREERPVLAMAAMLHNAGNFGIPFTALAFGKEAVPVTALVVVVQNVVGFLGGAALMGSGRARWTGLLKLPVLWAVAIPLLLRQLGLAPPAFLARPLTILHDGLIPVALLTLGVQLARSGPRERLQPLGLAVLLRLAAGPLVGWALARALGCDAATTALLTVISGFPVAVNVAIIAGEFRRGEALASQAILWTTIVSAATLTALRAAMPT